MTDLALARVLDEEPPPDDGYAPSDWTPSRNGHTDDRLPPQDLDAERAVIGGMLLSNEARDDVTNLIGSRDFYRPAHELIFDAIARLHLDPDTPVDTITVADDLEKHGDLKRAGGQSYLHECVASVPTAANAGHYATRVLEKARLRRLVEAGTRIAQLGYAQGSGDVDDIVQAAEAEVAAAVGYAPSHTKASSSSYARIDLGPVMEDILSGTYTGPRGAVLARRDGKMLLYPKAVHSISGEPGSAKSWCALIAAAQQLEEGQPVAFMDFEDNSHPVVMRLVNLGVPPEAILEHFRYVRPQHAFGSGDMRALDAEVADCGLTVIDGITEAMTINGLSPNDNDDVANWLHLLPNRIADQGPAVLQVDHVVKNAEQRGRYAIGGQHKLAGITGAAYKAVIVKPFAKGSAGHSKIVVDKDKHGDIGPVGITVADLHVDATDTSGKVFAWLDTPEKSTDEDGHFRPTVLMERVSKFLLAHVGPASLNTIKAGVKGKAESITEAVDALVREGHIRVENGPRGAAMHHLVEVFEER